MCVPEMMNQGSASWLNHIGPPHPCLPDYRLGVYRLDVYRLVVEQHQSSIEGVPPAGSE